MDRRNDAGLQAVAGSPGPQKILGWARNEIERWQSHDELELFDMILCSSRLASTKRSSRCIQGLYQLALPIGVDIELFGPESRDLDSRVGVVSTVNQWGREREHLSCAPIQARDLRPEDPRSECRASRCPGTHLFHRGPVDYFELPSIYRGTRIVLDDFNHTTVGWGAANSRLFESLASGALPITNSRLGLDDLGLGEVPTYKRPQLS